MGKAKDEGKWLGKGDIWKRRAAADSDTRPKTPLNAKYQFSAGGELPKVVANLAMLTTVTPTRSSDQMWKGCVMTVCTPTACWEQNPSHSIKHKRLNYRRLPVILYMLLNVFSFPQWEK